MKTWAGRRPCSRIRPDRRIRRWWAIAGARCGWSGWKTSPCWPSPGSSTRTATPTGNTARCARTSVPSTQRCWRSAAGTTPTPMRCRAWLAQRQGAGAGHHRPVGTQVPAFRRARTAHRIPAGDAALVGPLAQGPGHRCRQGPGASHLHHGAGPSRRIGAADRRTLGQRQPLAIGHPCLAAPASERQRRAGQYQGRCRQMHGRVTTDHRRRQRANTASSGSARSSPATSAATTPARSVSTARRWPRTSTSSAPRRCSSSSARTSRWPMSLCGSMPSGPMARSRA